MVTYIRSNQEFILDQILVAERNATGTPLSDTLPNVQVPWELRTVDGSHNNLVFNAALGIDQTQFGAADTVFPHLLAPVFSVVEGLPAGFFEPGIHAIPTTSYAQNNCIVADSKGQFDQSGRGQRE